ncbi:MAG: flagellar biosynthesis protein FlgD, partial [Gammaproteobacteria bacterium]|nr:flagellar biosynthesis protein FlgD [Gammaproteobacteria bacterium]
MSFTSIDSIRTTNDLLAEKNQAQVNQDLDRNAFLRLFTTQLQNQNPLDPMENEAFVAQLAQFSTLEATTLMSDSLSDFVSSQQSEKMLRGANLLGKQVFAPNVSMYQAGGTRLDGVISVDQTLDNLRLNVIDAESGQVVNQMDLGAQTQ